MTIGIIYDLDGTIIDTEKLHEEGWIFSTFSGQDPLTKNTFHKLFRD